MVEIFRAMRSNRMTTNSKDNIRCDFSLETSQVNLSRFEKFWRWRAGSLPSRSSRRRTLKRTMMPSSFVTAFSSGESLRTHHLSRTPATRTPSWPPWGSRSSTTQASSRTSSTSVGSRRPSRTPSAWSDSTAANSMSTPAWSRWPGTPSRRYVYQNYISLFHLSPSYILAYHLSPIRSFLTFDSGYNVAQPKMVKFLSHRYIWRSKLLILCNPIKNKLWFPSSTTFLLLTTEKRPANRKNIFKLTSSL